MVFIKGSVFIVVFIIVKFIVVFVFVSCCRIVV